MTFDSTKLSLRDKEYAKFNNSVGAGSETSINTTTIKTYEFGEITATSGAGSGLFAEYSTYDINGILSAIVVDESTWEDTGSLYLVNSGLNYDIWSMQSGTVTSMASSQNVYLPKGINRTTENVLMSGTLAAGMLGDIPMYGVVGIIGSGMGAGTSGLGITLVYK